MSHTNNSLLIILSAVVVTMVGLAYASVPLYRIFCQQTGFAGTTQVATTAPGKVLARTIQVHFNADIDANLPWEFKPLQSSVTVRIGEPFLAFYHAKNKLAQPVAGWATYNVTPEKAAAYFYKIECFCFTEQTLQAHQQVDMPVQFYIDPELADDPTLDDITIITLSYTFFPLKPGMKLPAPARPRL